MLLFLKNVLFTVLVPGAIGVYMPLRLDMASRGVLPLRSDALHIVALLPLLSGMVIYFWCLWNFAVLGRGTPAPVDPPKHLVVRGPYQYVRNPMYIGVLLLITGWAIFFQSWRILVYDALVGLLFHLFVVRVEESSLRKRFGESYDRYCKKVRRWIPKTSSS